jgi:hypothetical protein
LSRSVLRAALGGLVIGCAVAAACWAFAAPSWAGRPATCSAHGYTYAGIVGAAPVRGISATLTAVAAPSVASGHVAAWVGVGGKGLGPNGTSEWLQVGLAAYPGSASRLYYELMLAGGRRYVELDRHVARGERHDVAVVEVSAGVWQVRVDGGAASAPIALPGSHDAWPAVATGESWASGRSACNRYAYGFDRVAVEGADGSWRAPERARILRTARQDVVAAASPASFVAAARPS